MGYYVTLTESNFEIPEAKLDEAYRRMCALNERDDLKRGGCWGGDRDGARWFSWMDENYPETCPDAEAIFRDLGFDVRIAADGDLQLLGYDSKTGQEELFLAAVCDLAEPGSRLYWIGEDGERWMYEYGGEQPICYEAKITYERI